MGLDGGRRSQRFVWNNTLMFRIGDMVKATLEYKRMLCRCANNNRFCKSDREWYAGLLLQIMKEQLVIIRTQHGEYVNIKFGDTGKELQVLSYYIELV